MFITLYAEHLTFITFLLFFVACSWLKQLQYPNVLALRTTPFCVGAMNGYVLVLPRIATDGEQMGENIILD